MHPVRFCTPVAGSLEMNDSGLELTIDKNVEV